MVFPLGKLLYLVLKQVARPVSRQLQATAKNREFMKNRILTPMGQLLHRMDLFIRMRVMGLAGPVEVKPLKDSVALESGADVLGEIFVFSVGAGILTAEYFRLSNKEAKREEYELEKISELVSSLNRVNATIQQMEGEVTELKSRVEQVECAKVNKK